MDYRHFGFRSRPFRTTPDADGYYPATGHESSLAQLQKGLEDEEGLLLLQGPPGSGKTLIGHRLIEALPDGARSVLLIHGSYRQRLDLLQAILFDLGLPYSEMSEQELRLSLYESCLEHFAKMGRTIIVVDEAHLLSKELLEELRLLGNLEGKEGKAVQVVLIGLPEILETISGSGLEIFRQRLSVVCALELLSLEESADYLLHHIRRAGGRPEQLLGEDVLDILSHACRGVPRHLNQAASLAFSLAEDAGSRVVDAEAAVEAISRLGLDATDQARDLDERAIPEAIEVESPMAAEAIPLPSAAPAPAISVREEMPPMYVYEGGRDDDQRFPIVDATVPRVWQSSPQRAG